MQHVLKLDVMKLETAKKAVRQWPHKATKQTNKELPNTMAIAQVSACG